MVNYDEALNESQFIGMLDSNVDGKIQKSELRGQVGEQIAKYWDMLDTDHDGSLDKAELARMQAMGQKRAEKPKPAAPAAGAATPTAGK